MQVFLREEHWEIGKKKPSYSFRDRLLSQYIFEQIESQAFKKKTVHLQKGIFMKSQTLWED